MKILLIGAHPDDCEFSCGALICKCKSLGCKLRILSVSDGSGGHHIMSPQETAERRKKEAASVAKLLGIEYDVWDIKDGNIVADLPTRKRLIRYIREFSPDIIITNRPNDYHADHRAVGQLIMDTSYLLTVPHECPDIEAMKTMPVIIYWEDGFKNPPFSPDIVINSDDEVETKYKLINLNSSQVYEWLPYVEGVSHLVPSDTAKRLEWVKGAHITEHTTDDEVMSMSRGYAVRFAQTAARYRGELIKKYGVEKGSKIRFAEAYELCEYGSPISDELMKKIFSL